MEFGPACRARSSYVASALNPAPWHLLRSSVVWVSQCRNHLHVAELGKASIVISDCTKAGRLAETHDPVRFLGQLGGAVGRRNGNRHNDLAGRSSSQGANRHFHGGSSGDAIIDHDCCLFSDGDWLPSATVSKPAAFEFRTLPVDQCPQLGIIEPIDLDYLAIEHHFRWIAVDNCRDCQLRVTRRSDLRTITRSIGALSTRAISTATGTPPRGNASTTGSCRSSFASWFASFSPASCRFRNMKSIGRPEFTQRLLHRVPHLGDFSMRNMSVKQPEYSRHRNIGILEIVREIAFDTDDEGIFLAFPYRL